MARPKNFIIHCIGDFERAGVSEIMFGAIQIGDVERYQQVDEAIVSAFR